MANELPNAAALLTDALFRAWATAVCVYTARVVVEEDPATADHDKRMALAQIVLGSPGYGVDIMLSLLATTPAICGLGATPVASWQNVMISTAAAYWTPLAKLLV